MKCKEVIAHLEQLSPLEYACDWDNVGLLVGHEQQEIHSIMVALDPTLKTVEEAVLQKVDMLITHHPLIFKSVNRISEQDACGRKLLQLTENHIAYYAMHTNFDIMGSMSRIVADRFDLSDLQPLEETAIYNEEPVGIGYIGNLEQEISLEECAKLVKKQFHIEGMRVYGEKQCRIRKVAVSPGSGKSMINLAKQKGAEVLITGDIGHHEGIDAVEMGLSVIDATHYGLEHVFAEFIKEYLEKLCSDVTVHIYDSKSPYWTI